MKPRGRNGLINKKLLPIILLATLTISLCAPAAFAVEEEKPVVVCHLKGALEADVQLKAIMDNMTYYEWSVVLGELTSSDLSEADMLIMSKSDSTAEYTSSELNAISGWLDEGGKTLWVAADSDYGDDEKRQPTANDVLEAVGSKLRIESSSAEDPVLNGGAPYRVYGISDNVDENFEFLTAGVETALFHGPGIIVGLENGEYKSLEEVEDTFIIMTTTETGVVVNNNPPDPEVHGIGVEGNFPLMAIEIDFDGSNVIIATGESPFDQYTAMYMPEVRNYERYAIEYPQQGAKLFENIVKFSTEYSEEFIQLHALIREKNTQISDLQAQMDSLQSEVEDLETQVSNLESDNAELESKLSAAKSSTSTWQMVAGVLLIVGVVVGYFVGPMIKKQ